MELIRKLYDKDNLANLVIACLVIGLCIFAMFGAPTMSAQGRQSQLTVGEPSVWTVVLIGLAIGCYGTIVGIGGGPLIVPVLVLYYGWENEFLVATSLFIVFLNALSGSIGYARQKRIDYKGGLKFALAALPGGVISAFVHHTFNIEIFDIIFAVFLILLAVYSLMSVKKLDTVKRITVNPKKSSYRRVKFADGFGDKYDFYSNDLLGISMNLLLGFFVGFLGIGGGVFQVPILLFLLYYPPHIATATSHFITMLTCFFALIPHIYLGNVYFAEALWMGLGIVVGAQFGAAIAPKIKSKLLIYLFVVVLFVFTVKLIF